MLIQFRKRYGNDILFLLGIVLCGLKFTNHLPEIIDYPISDEGAYLQDGLDIPQNGIRPLCWGSLYNIWYYAGSFLIHDKIQLFYAHVRLVTIGVPFLFYILLRIIGLSSLVSFCTAFLYLISFGNLYIFHKGNHTALFLMLLILVVGRPLHRSIHFYLLAAVSVLISAFIRPELFIAFWLLMAWYVYLVIQSNIWTMRKILIVFGVVVATIYFSRLMFTNENRSFYTFQSNFPVNWVKWNNIKLDPDQNNAMLFKQAFGDATTIGQAFQNNPKIFMKNMIWNVEGMGENYLKLGTTHFNLLLPASERKYTFIEGVLLLVIISFFAWFRNRKNFNFKSMISENSRWLWFSLFLFIPCAIANILFYPRFNYVVLPIFLSFLLFPLLFFKQVKINLPVFAIPVLIIILYLVTPSPALGNNWYFAQAGRNNNLEKTPVKNIVETINALHLKHPCVSYLAEKAIYQYTDKLINGVTIYHEGISIEDFIAKNNLEILVVSDLLLTNDIVNHIDGFSGFIKNPESLHFRRININNTSAYLLISESALVD